MKNSWRVPDLYAVCQVLALMATLIVFLSSDVLCVGTILCKLGTRQYCCLFAIKFLSIVMSVTSSKRHLPSLKAMTYFHALISVA